MLTAQQYEQRRAEVSFNPINTESLQQWNARQWEELKRRIAFEVVSAAEMGIRPIVLTAPHLVINQVEERLLEFAHDHGFDCFIHRCAHIYLITLTVVGTSAPCARRTCATMVNTRGPFAMCMKCTIYTRDRPDLLSPRAREQAEWQLYKSTRAPTPPPSPRSTAASLDTVESYDLCEHAPRRELGDGLQLD